MGGGSTTFIFVLYPIVRFRKYKKRCNAACVVCKASIFFYFDGSHVLTGLSYQLVT